MDFPNIILISALLVVGLSTSVLAENSVQNYEVLTGKISCNENGSLYPKVTEIRKGQKLQVGANHICLSEIMFNRDIGDIRLFEIFATEKVVIDVDLDQVGKMLQVVIIAPTWEVIGNRKFNLNGEDGNEPVEKIAKNGSSPGNKNGAHGVAGLPGGPAGSFYGIADRIINGGNLTILANGGKGGRGQDGGHGANGEDGKTYEGVPGFDIERKEVPGWKTSHYVRNRNSVIYVVEGKVGKRGGRGGNGGVGGTGGIGGNIIVQELLKHDLGMSPVISTKNGEKGSGGFGGNGGLGGKNGNNTVVENQKGITVSRHLEKSPEYTGFAESGLSGKPGTSLKMRETPKNPAIVQNFPSSINEYKMFARIQLAQLDLSQGNILSKFYASLNTQEEVAKWYDTLSLVEEFTGLEMQYLGLHQRVNLTSSYQALQKRIQNYAENPYKKNEKAENYHDVLRDLHSDISEKMRNIYLGKEYPVTTNIKRKIDILAEELIEKMLNSVKVDNILVLVNKEKQTLNDMIENAQYTITNEIQPVMDDLDNTLNEEINALLIENSELKKKADDKLDELAENRKQLERNILLKRVFEVLKVGYGVLGMINPALGLAGDLASSDLSAIEARSIKSDNAASEISIPDSVKDVSKVTEKIFKDEKQQQLYDQHKKFLEKKNEEAKIKSYETTIKAFAGLQTGSETVSSIMNDQNKIDEVEKAMQRTQENLEKLDQYEEQVYNVTEPMLKDMMETLSLTGKEISSMDENQLSVTNWNVTETIMNVQHILKNMTKDFSVTENINWTLNKLIRAFEFMIEMHTQVLKYQSEIKYKKFIAGLHIAHRRYLLTTDSRLSSALARLQAILSYNFVSDTYDECVSAFKQFVFPYAGLVLEQLQLPDIFKSRKLSNLIHDVKKNVISLKKSMDHEEESYELLRIFGRGIFMGSPSSMRAFYTWRSEKHKTEIQNILSGKETKLVANITQESLNALKFNKLGVVFTSKNHEILDMLNGALENFKVDLTHHGDSVYKCGDGIYEIRNAPISLVYSFKKDSKGEPVYQDEIYQEITNGECMLSPFATWSVQLLSDDGDFKILEQFKDKVDLELIGHGKYVGEPNVKCENNMEKYYTKIGSFN